MKNSTILLILVIVCNIAVLISKKDDFYGIQSAIYLSSAFIIEAIEYKK